jgi:hypothetical protein
MFLSDIESTRPTAMNEYRSAPRRRMRKAGTIEFGGAGIDCAVRNIAENGAAHEVVTPLFIPDRFTLFLPSDQFKRPGRIIWHKEKRIGVAFVATERTFRSQQGDLSL